MDKSVDKVRQLDKTLDKTLYNRQTSDKFNKKPHETFANWTKPSGQIRKSIPGKSPLWGSPHSREIFEYSWRVGRRGFLVEGDCHYAS